MSQRSDSVQTDPVRRRLGKPVVARDVTCPNCSFSYATEIPWHMRCPNCGFEWLDRSRRTVVDEMRDSLHSGIGTLVLVAFALFAAYFAVAIVVATLERFGLSKSVPVALLIFACAGSIIGLGLLRNRVTIQKSQRRSPWRPESGFDIPLSSNLYPLGPKFIKGNRRRDPDHRDELPEGDN